MAGESTGMKLAFVALGILWLGLGLAVALSADRAWVLGVTLAVGTLWYLVPGTVVSVVVLVLLLTPQVRRARSRVSIRRTRHGAVDR